MEVQSKYEIRQYIWCPLLMLVCRTFPGLVTINEKVSATCR